MLNRMAWVNVSLGLMAVLIAIFVLRGFRAEVSEKLYALMGHLNVRPYFIPGMSKELLVDLSEGVYQKYKSGHLSGIRFIQPYARQAALLKVNERVIGIQFKGIALAYDAPEGLPGLELGRIPDFSAPKYSSSCVLSQKVANELNVSIGDSLVIHILKQPPQYRRLEVSGLYRSALDELDDHLVFGDIRLLHHIHGWRNQTAEGLEVFLHNLDHQEEQIEQLFEEVNYGLEVISTSKDYPQIFDWFSILDQNTYIFLCLMIAVAGFNMLALCMILVMERRPMITTLSALGATRGWLRKLFFVHSLLWLLWGMMWGNLFAFGLSFLQSKYKLLRLDAENYAMDYVPIHIEAWSWSAANLGFFACLTIVLWLSLRAIVPQDTARLWSR